MNKQEFQQAAGYDPSIEANPDAGPGTLWSVVADAQGRPIEAGCPCSANHHPGPDLARVLRRDLVLQSSRDEHGDR